MDYIHRCDSPLGPILLASDGAHLIGLWFDDQQHFASTLDQYHQPKYLPVFQETEKWLSLYFSGIIPDFLPPLLLRGTDFRRAIWEILLQIPYGHTVTYGDISRQLAARKGIPRMSAQAVGCAVGHNPISLIIPCHRVVGTDGSMTGYAGGIHRKQWLLQMESDRK